MVWENGGACELLCVAVAVYRNCGLWGFQYVGVAVRRSQCGELWCGSVTVRGNCGVCELRCVTAAVYRSYSL